MQFKIGILVMIELYARPVFIMMALMAFYSPVSIMHVVKVVTEIAVFRRFYVALVDMTILAADFLVGIAQGEISFIMIKIGR